MGVAERVARKAAGQCPAWGTGRMRVWPGLAVCISCLLCPAPLKLSKHGPGARGGLPRSSPGKGWLSTMHGWRKWPLFAFLQPRELPSLCVFALLPSSCLLWRAGHPVDPGPGAPDASRAAEAAQNSSAPGLSSQTRLDSWPLRRLVKQLKPALLSTHCVPGPLCSSPCR